MSQTDPIIKANILSAKTPITPDDHEILIVGQLVSGTATSGDLIENLLSEADFNAAFGRTSQIAKGGRALLNILDLSTIRPKVSAIGLADNGSAVDATGTVVFAGTATEAGTITITIDSIKNGTYEVDVADGDTATEVGDALVTLITANLDSPVTAANVTGTVTLTAVNGGTQGNTIGLKQSGTVAGITTTIAAKLASGATDPVLTTLFDPIDDKRFQTIIYPAEWGISTLTDETESRFNVDNKVLDGMGIVSETDTFANLNTTLDGLNSGQGFRTLIYLPNKLVDDADHRGGAIFESPYVVVAQFAGYRGLRLTVDANISSFSQNGISLGGFFMGAVPYHNTPFSNLTTIETGKGLTDIEIQELIDSGGLMLVNNQKNTSILTRSGVTTYKLNSLGNADNTFKFINFVDSLSIVREYMFDNAKGVDFVQHSLTDSEQIISKVTVNREIIIGIFLKYYDTLAKDKRFTLLRAGESERQAFQKAIVDSIVIDLANGKISLETIGNILSQVRIINIDITPTFN